MPTTDDIIVERGSGNVFADLGFENPEEEALKAGIVRRIRALIERRGLTQTAAAERLGLRQPDVSDLLRGKGHFSLERLLRFLVLLGDEVEIIVRPSEPGASPRLRLSAA